MRRALARWRWAGLGVVWDAADPDDTPWQATAETVPQAVNLTVVYVQAGAHVSFGSIISIDAAAFAPVLGQGAYDAGIRPTTLIRAAIDTDNEEAPDRDRRDDDAR